MTTPEKLDLPRFFREVHGESWDLRQEGSATVAELSDVHDIRFRSHDVTVDTFRKAATEKRMVSLGWDHEHRVSKVWQIAAQLFNDHFERHAQSAPVVWWVNYCYSEEAGTYTDAELAEEARNGGRIFDNDPSNVSGFIISCGEVSFEACGANKENGELGQAFLLWPEGCLKDATVAFALTSSRYPQDYTAELVPEIMTVAQPL